jgi:hypothetical protein
MIRKPGLFFGDSRYDYEAAQRAGIDFAFVSGWTGAEGWEHFVRHIQIPTVDALGFRVQSSYICANALMLDQFSS